MRPGVDIKKLLQKIANISLKGERVAKAVVQSQADLMVVDAKKNAPGDLGNLRQSIGKTSLNDGFQASIFVNAPYAPYVEFGTGAKVKVPAEWGELASKFKGKGNGSWKEFEIAIKDWMKRHGVQETEWMTDKDGNEYLANVVYYIMIGILHNGLKAQPFLYPAYQGLRARLPNVLKKAIKALVAQESKK